MTMFHVFAALFCYLTAAATIDAVCPDATWRPSISVPGKCYKLISTTRSNGVDTSFVSDCRAQGQDADALGIMNAFENQEIIGMLQSANVNAAAIGLLWIATANDGSTHNLTWIPRCGTSSYAQSLVTVDPSSHASVVAVTNAGQWVPRSNLTTAICQIYPNNPNDPTCRPDPIPNCPSGFQPALGVPNKCINYDGPQNLNYFDAALYCENTYSATLVSFQSTMEQPALWELPSTTWINYINTGSGWTCQSPHNCTIPFGLLNDSTVMCAAALGSSESGFYTPRLCDDLLRTVCEIWVDGSVTTTAGAGTTWAYTTTGWDYPTTEWDYTTEAWDDTTAW